MQFRRQEVNKVDITRQELVTNKLFDPVDNWRQLQGNHHANHHAAQAAEQPRQQTVPDEDGANKTVFRPQRTQHGDVAALVLDRHHQRRDDIKARHTNHQHHRQIHNGANHLDITVHIAVSADPALDVDIVIGHAARVADQLVGVKDVVHLDGNARHAVGHVEILACILHRHHCKAMVKLTAQLKNTGDVQAHALRLLQLVVGAGVRDHD